MLHRFKNIEFHTIRKFVAQLRDELLQILIKYGQELVRDAARKGRIQELAMLAPFIASQRNQSSTQECFNEPVRGALVDAQRRVEYGFRMIGIIDLHQ